MTAADVRERVDRLLAEHANDDETAFLGAQFDAGLARMDYPVAGMGLAALGAHLVTSSSDPEHGVRLLALGLRFHYNRTFPVMAWEPLRALADAAAPGRLDAVLEEYGDRRGRELRGEADRVLALTSSG